MKGKVTRKGEKVVMDVGGEQQAGGGIRGLRFAGLISDLTEEDRAALLDRSTSRDEGIKTQTEAIIEFVRDIGDEAIRGLTRELDKVTLGEIEVPRAALVEALGTLDPALRRVMERAIRNITVAHAALRPVALEVETEPGVMVGRRPDPLAIVGVYAPGGRAVYPSSVLMGVVPAKVAGVKEVIVCSPPGVDGMPSKVVLAAAALAGADRVFAIGGAQAVAAMAFGTATVPRVDRIVGPGNAFVTEAKVQVSSRIGIDAPAGPSEILAIGDESSDPVAIARELIAQAEHDPRSCAIAVLTDPDTARMVARALDAGSRESERREIVGEALASHGGVLVAGSLDEAIEFANEYAPEHLFLSVEAPDEALGRLRNAGAVFIGDSSSVAFGDYITGGNHVLPTGGLARSFSGLSMLDYYRWTSYQRVSPDAAERLAADTALFAEAEGLPGHALAARAWQMDAEK